MQRSLWNVTWINTLQINIYLPCIAIWMYEIIYWRIREKKLTSIDHELSSVCSFCHLNIIQLLSFLVTRGFISHIKEEFNIQYRGILRLIHIFKIKIFIHLYTDPIDDKPSIDPLNHPLLVPNVELQIAHGCKMIYISVRKQIHYCQTGLKYTNWIYYSQCHDFYIIITVFFNIDIEIV